MVLDDAECDGISIGMSRGVWDIDRVSEMSKLGQKSQEWGERRKKWPIAADPARRSRRVLDRCVEDVEGRTSSQESSKSVEN